MNLIRSVLTRLSPAGAGGRLSILIYHRILEREDSLTGEVTAAAFNVHLRSLREYFEVLPLAEAVEKLNAGTLPARAAAITFDDGYADNAEVALPILLEHRMNATFFIADAYLNGGRMFNDTIIEAIRRTSIPVLALPSLGLDPMPLGSNGERRAAIAAVIGACKYLEGDARLEAVSRVAHASAVEIPDDLMMTDAQVRKLDAAGMHIGGHTRTHPILARVDPETARADIDANRRALSALISRPVSLFAYPNGKPIADYGPEHVSIVRKLGYSAAVSTSWGAASQGSDAYQLPRFTPWDRDPRRFVVRLASNIAFRQAAVTSPQNAASRF